MNKIKSFFHCFVFIISMGIVPASQAATDHQMTDEILVYVNQYRAQHGLPKLAMSPSISQQALQHSHDMAAHVVPFGHDGFNHRIQHLHQQIKQSSSGAENVAYNYTTARIVVDGWIKSPAHRRNMLGHYNLTGIGIARDKTGKIYYTQLFLHENNAVTVHNSREHGHNVRINGTHQHGHHDYS